MQNGSARRLLALFALAAVLITLIPGSAVADELYARVRGTVTDPSGAVLPGVTLKVTNTATGAYKEATSNQDGTFEFPNLSPGTYSLSASKGGFNTYQLAEIRLLANQVYVAPIKMVVGAATQEITVTANPAQVEQSSMQLTATISDKTITDLPLNGRNWVNLQQTLPGVVNADTRFTTNFSTNGSQAQQNSYLINGTDANDLPLNTPLAPPNPDAIAEVRMVTNTINPEYGRNSGAIMNAITKSGTNQFHGSAFEFYRDTSLNTHNFFQLHPSVFHQHQYGGTIGGPIIKNHTFFFFSLQNTRNRTPQAGGLVTVYSPAALAGQLSGFSRLGSCSAGSGAACLSNKTTPFAINGFPAGTPWKTALAGGTVPTSAFSPLAVNLVKQFVPLPNFTSNQFTFNPITAAKTNQYIGRLDQNFGQKNSVWFYAYANDQTSQSTLPFTGATLPGFGDQSVPYTKQFTASWNHTFTPSVLNELRVGYTRLNFQTVIPQKLVQPKDVGFPSIFPQIPAGSSYPKMTVTGYFTLGFSDNGPQPRKDQTYQITDNFSWIHGKHSFKFGYEGRKFQVWNPFGARNNGSFTFSTSGTYSTGDPGLDFLLGIPFSYNQQTGQTIIAQSYEHYAYMQDQWRVRDNLTVTLGTGYQIDNPIEELQEKGLARVCFIPGQQSKLFPTAPLGYNFPTDPGCNKAGGATTKYTHFGPRLGFAFSPNLGRISGGPGKMSIRGGFGIYYNRSEEELNLQDLGDPPFGLSSNGIGDLGGDPAFPDPWHDIKTGQVLTNKFPFGGVTPGAPVDFSDFLPFGISVNDKNNTIPYAMNYNLTIERELPGQTILRVGYVGSQGRKLFVSRSFNPATPAGVAACLASATCVSKKSNQPILFPSHYPFPGDIWGNSGIQYNGGSSNYNSLQVTVDKHLTHGLQVLSTYTWAHSLDVSSSFEDTSFLTAGGFEAYGNLRRDYGDSTFDARHRWTFSFSYDVPNLNKLSWFSWMPSRLFGGWRLTGINTVQTGFPIKFQDSNNNSLTCSTSFSFYSCPDRPDLVTFPTALDAHTATFNNKTNYYFNPASFKDNALGTQGTMCRGCFHGPGFWNVDFSLQKDTHITEGTNIQLRVEMFNLLNHTNFANPTADFASSNFGRITAITGNSRLVQLGAKFIF